MTKNDFRKKVIAPLTELYGYPILFNGAEAQAKGLSARGYLGVSYSRKDKPIVITWQRDLYDTLQTLFHELGHSRLHGKGTGFKGGKNIKEIEAEMVARETCRLLVLPYRSGFKYTPHVNYIDHFTKRYHASCERFGYEPKQPRVEEIMTVASELAMALREVF